MQISIVDNHRHRGVVFLQRNTCGHVDGLLVWNGVSAILQILRPHLH